MSESRNNFLCEDLNSNLIELFESD